MNAFRYAKSQIAIHWLAAAQIGLHLLAALYHPFVVKEGLLARMGVGSNQAAGR